jgi:hypothetical protein
MSIKINNSNPFGTLPLDRLADFENKTGIELPAEYKNFLLCHNGGQPIPSFFWIEPNEDGSSVYQFYGLHSGSNPFSIDALIPQNKYGLPGSLLPIGDDGVGNYICVGISNDNFGVIFFLDHDTHPFNYPNSMVGVTILANSFDEFLLSFVDAPG